MECDSKTLSRGWNIQRNDSKGFNSCGVYFRTTVKYFYFLSNDILSEIWIFQIHINSKSKIFENCWKAACQDWKHKSISWCTIKYHPFAVGWVLYSWIFTKLDILNSGILYIDLPNGLNLNFLELLDCANLTKGLWKRCPYSGVKIHFTVGLEVFKVWYK